MSFSFLASDMVVLNLNVNRCLARCIATPYQSSVVSLLKVTAASGATDEMFRASATIVSAVYRLLVVATTTLCIRSLGRRCQNASPLLVVNFNTLYYICLSWLHYVLKEQFSVHQICSVLKQFRSFVTLQQYIIVLDGCV
jgi:hypothetical protein